MRFGTLASMRRFAVIGALLALSACGGGGGTDTAGTGGTGGTGGLPPVANRAPVAADVFGVNAQLNTVLSGALPAATDPDGDALIYELGAAPALGVVQISANGNFSYTPNRTGVDRFRYRVVDARGGSSPYYVVQVAVSHPDAGPPPADGKKIAFVTARDGNEEIYVVNSDGTGLARLTNHPARDRDPAWSPDGTRIAFVSDRSGPAEIHVMRADGSEVVRLTFSGRDGETASPTWSPDGSRIAYGNGDIWVVGAADGGPAPALLFSSLQFDGHPAWSPDDKQIAFASDLHAYDYPLRFHLINADGTGTPRWIGGNFFDGSEQQHPSWSPDGARLTATVAQPGGETYLCTMNADGSGLTRLVPASASTKSSWSADGRRIAFSSGSATARKVAWVGADGSGFGTIVTDGWDPNWQR
jgi:dipeptidyl aminopeptidase/acylaminoacyl peptidase